MEKTINEILDANGTMEIETEEQALAYLDFLQKKMDELDLSNNVVAKNLAGDFEKRLDSAPRAVRRMYQKEKFSDRFKNNINKK